MRAHRAVAGFVALTLVVAACGGVGDDAAEVGAGGTEVTNPDATTSTIAAEGGDGAGGQPADEAPAAEAEFLPDIDVVRVATGETVALRSVATAQRPTLLWFWAPHCTFCIREAPDVLALAASHGDKIQIIGLGAQDDLAQAVGFLELTGTGDLDMVWDATGETWIHFGVTSQPTVVVVSPDGEVQATWFREFDEAGILEAAGLS